MDPGCVGCIGDLWGMLVLRRTGGRLYLLLLCWLLTAQPIAHGEWGKKEMCVSCFHPAVCVLVVCACASACVCMCRWLLLPQTKSKLALCSVPLLLLLCKIFVGLNWV